MEEMRYKCESCLYREHDEYPNCPAEFKDIVYSKGTIINCTKYEKDPYRE